jgi:hypothetical protein
MPKRKQPVSPFDPTGLEWPPDEDAGFEILTLWVAVNRLAFGQVVRRTCKVVGLDLKGLQQALSADGLKTGQSNLVHMLGVKKASSGHFTEARLRVMLEAMGVSARWFLMRVEALPLPEDEVIVWPYPPAVFRLVEALLEDAAVRGHFNAYRREVLMPEWGRMRACAAYLWQHGWLVAENLDSAEVSLNKAFSGEKVMDAPLFSGVCAYLERDPQAVAEAFFPWLEKPKKRGRPG